jgi:hypothetical protein
MRVAMDAGNLLNAFLLSGTIGAGYTAGCWLIGRVLGLLKI